MTDPMELHALADGELGQEETARLRDALTLDARAAAEVNAILNLKDVLANHSLRQSDEEAWRGCLRRLDAIDKTRRVEGFVGRYAWALCGLMFVFIVSGRFAMRGVAGDSAQTREIASIFGRPARPISAEDRAKKKEYAALLGAIGNSLDPNGIDIGAPAFGRVRDLPAMRVPLRDRAGDLVLTRIDGPIDLRDTSPIPANPALSAGVSNGQNVLVWQSEGRTYLLCGDRPLSSLGDVAARVLGAR